MEALIKLSIVYAISVLSCLSLTEMREAKNLLFFYILFTAFKTLIITFFPAFSKLAFTIDNKDINATISIIAYFIPTMCLIVHYAQRLSARKIAAYAVIRS